MDEKGLLYYYFFYYISYYSLTWFIEYWFIRYNIYSLVSDLIFSTDENIDIALVIEKDLEYFERQSG